MSLIKHIHLAKRDRCHQFRVICSAVRGKDLILNKRTSTHIHPVLLHETFASQHSLFCEELEVGLPLSSLKSEDCKRIFPPWQDVRLYATLPRWERPTPTLTSPQDRLLTYVFSCTVAVAVTSCASSLREGSPQQGSSLDVGPHRWGGNKEMKA